MLLSISATVLVLLSCVPVVLSYPGMGEKVDMILARQAESGDSYELLGDLLTLPDSALTAVGKDIKELLQDSGDPESTEYYSNVPQLGSSECAAATCCVWHYIANDMVSVFRGKSGRCTKYARMAVRLGFHDAAGWNKATATANQQGGADGSIILNPVEMTLSENNGLQLIVAQMQTWYDKWHNQEGYSSVTMADLIQFGANVAAVTCPQGPRIKTYVGRKDSNVQNPRLLPGVTQSADDLISLFQDKTIQPNGLVALLGAHTTSQQHFVDLTRDGDPQDTTPGIWDVLFYAETLANNIAPRVFKFASDIAISKHPLTKSEWQEFAGSQGNGQSHWNEDYAREYIRLSLLGVNNINNLTECTKSLPLQVLTYNSPDQTKLNQWLAATSLSESVHNASLAIDNGDSIINLVITTFGDIGRRILRASHYK